MASGLGWMSIETAAQELMVSVEVIREGVRAGTLPALILGEEVRISRDGLVQLAAQGGENRQISIGARAQDEKGMPNPVSSVPVPRGLAWLGELTPGPAFVYEWPQSREDYGNGENREEYPKTSEGKIRLNGDEVEVIVGIGLRAGRGRMTVFFNGTAVCEFVDHVQRDAWASIIKPNGKKVLKADEVPPALYRRCRIEPYRAATGLSGTGVPHGMSVVIAEDDPKSAVHHAAARWLGRRNLPVVEA